jgi:uncharacterized membrane protein (UPF0127 family)
VLPDSPAVSIDERRITWLRRAAALVVVAGLVACAGEGGSAPEDPSLPPPGETQGAVTSASTTPASASETTSDPDGREDAVPAPDPDAVPTSALPATTSTRMRLPGFGEVEVQVRRVDGQTVEWCLLLAETGEQRSRGLMEVADPALGGYDGMLFRFEEAQSGAFYMRNTAQALSIAYVGDDGSVGTILEMEPCEDRDGCPTYESEDDFRWAVEVPVDAGGVDALGLEEGAVLVDTGAVCSA